MKGEFADGGEVTDSIAYGEESASRLISGASGGKGTKAKKSNLSKESQPLELKTEKELPENAEYMMDCEAFEILEGIKEHISVLFEDPSIKIPVSFNSGLEYLKYRNCYTNPQSVRQILEPLKKHGVSESEVVISAKELQFRQQNPELLGTLLLIFKRDAWNSIYTEISPLLVCF